jgi:hypothetical protein
MDKITSHNQSGGITAKNVAFGSGGAGDNRPPREPRLKVWHVIVGVITVLAGAVALLEYIGVGPIGRWM